MASEFAAQCAQQIMEQLIFTSHPAGQAATVKTIIDAALADVRAAMRDNRRELVSLLHSLHNAHDSAEVPTAPLRCVNPGCVRRLATAAKALEVERWMAEGDDKTKPCPKCFGSEAHTGPCVDSDSVKLSQEELREIIKRDLPGWKLHEKNSEPTGGAQG